MVTEIITPSIMMYRDAVIDLLEVESQDALLQGVSGCACAAGGAGQRSLTFKTESVACTITLFENRVSIQEVDGDAYNSAGASTILYTYLPDNSTE